MKSNTIAGAAALSVVALLLIAMFATAASSQIPEKMNYQVMLTDDADQPLAGQNLTATFRLFDVATGGPILWSETQNVTTNSIGVASVILGSVNALNISFADPLWLEIEVEGEILLPRRELVSVPYAFHADTATYALVGGPADTAQYAYEAGYADTASYALAAPPCDTCAYAVAAGSAAQSANADSLGHVAAAGYPLASALSDSGTINDSGNPVSWTKLKDVPAGFADGVDDTGAGASYYLSADDGDPAQAVLVDSLGNVRIWAAGEETALTLIGDSASYLELVARGATVRDSTTFAVAAAADTDAVLVNTGGGIGIGTGGPYLSARFTPDGALRLGGPGTIYDGALRVVEGGTSNELATIYKYDDVGGALELYTPDVKAAHTQLEPDIDGGGGFLYVDAPDGGLIVDGNEEADGSMAVLMEGTGASVEFDLGNTGNDSVILPNDAVSSTEQLDEPGVACYYTPDGVAMTSIYEPVVSQSIVAPGPGYAFVMATGQANCTHDTTEVARLFFGVSPDSIGVADGLDEEIQLPTELNGGAYKFAFAPAAVFPISAAGTYTYYLNARAQGAWYIYDTAITVIYFPTAYGSVPGSVRTPAAANDEDAIVQPSTIESRRAEAEAMDRARVEKELADMEARIAELRARMESANDR